MTTEAGAVCGRFSNTEGQLWSWILGLFDRSGQTLGWWYKERNAPPDPAVVSTPKKKASKQSGFNR